MYIYRAIVNKVYDGDTITVDIDLGFNIWKKNESIRLLGIDAPEIRGEEREQGLISKKFLSHLVLHKEVEIRTHKDSKGKYGRYLAIIIVNELNVNEYMIQKGFATKYID